MAKMFLRKVVLRREGKRFETSTEVEPQDFGGGIIGVFDHLDRLNGQPSLLREGDVIEFRLMPYEKDRRIAQRRGGARRHTFMDRRGEHGGD